jgi:hypothetical protein
MEVVRTFYSVDGSYVEVLPRRLIVALAVWDELPGAYSDTTAEPSSSMLDVHSMVAVAMCLIHAQGYVHLDVKPRHLMVRAFNTGDEQHPYLLSCHRSLTSARRTGSVACCAAPPTPLAC